MKVNDYDPIADLYDIYVPATYDIDFFLRETARAKGEVLELMSGSGRVSLPLIQAGVKLTCVDISAELNAILRKKLVAAGLEADIVQMDICSLQLQKQFEMVIIPFHSFAHLVSKNDQQAVLERIHAHLLAGGIFICTLGNPSLRGKTVDGQLRLFRKYSLPEDGGTLFLWIAEKFDPDDPQVVQADQFFEEYDQNCVLKSKRLLELHFRLTEKEEFEAMAIEAGFRIKEFYGDYAYSRFQPESSPAMVWIMEKA